MPKSKKKPLKKKNKKQSKMSPFQLMTFFEENLCKAQTLNHALTVTMDNPVFTNANFEILMEIDDRLRDMQSRIADGYRFKV